MSWYRRIKPHWAVAGFVFGLYTAIGLAQIVDNNNRFWTGTQTFQAPVTFTDTVTGLTLQAIDAQSLTVDGTSTLTGAVTAGSTIAATGVITAGSGTAAAPGYGFADETGLGMYRVGAANLGFGVGGALVFDVENTNAAGAGADLTTVSSTLGIMDGSDTVNGIAVNLTNSNHTGTGNEVNGISFGNITGDADAAESAIKFGTGYDADIEAATNFAVTVDGNDLGVWMVATGTLTATQVRKLNATPVEVIAAPAAGFAIELESARFMLDWNANAYDGVVATEDISLEYAVDGSSLLQCDNSTCLDADAVADAFGIVHRPAAAIGHVLATADAINITILVGEWAAADLDANGDSPLHYLLTYRLIDVDDIVP